MRIDRVHNLILSHSLFHPTHTPPFVGSLYLSSKCSPFVQKRIIIYNTPSFTFNINNSNSHSCFSFSGPLTHTPFLQQLVQCHSFLFSLHLHHDSHLQYTSNHIQHQSNSPNIRIKQVSSSAKNRTRQSTFFHHRFLFYTSQNKWRTTPILITSNGKRVGTAANKAELHLTKQQQPSNQQLAPLHSNSTFTPIIVSAQSNLLNTPQYSS
jgi:hypothetical protein